jgi:predicted amidohydrolase
MPTVACRSTRHEYNTMDKPIVATVQQQMRVFEKQEEYQEDVFRYMRMAQAKNASLVIFPALSAVMLIPSLASSPRLGLMKRAEKGRGRWASLKDRLLGRAADAAGQALGGGLRGEMNRLLNKAPEALYEAYVDLFSAAALKYKVTVVAGSLYLRASEGANCKHVCFVFGPNGQIIGQQEKVHLTVEEMRFCQGGERFTAIETEIGRIGILIGEDTFFPEAGRLLAYQGADVLINLVACDGSESFHQFRHAFVARLNENELMGAQSCIVGSNRLTASGQDFTGKSGLLVPVPLSPRLDGILFEMGGMAVEGIIAETLNLAAMRQQWTQDTPRLRQGMRMLAYQPLSAIYRDLRTLDQAYHSPRELTAPPSQPALEEPGAPAVSQEPQEEIPPPTTSSPGLEPTPQPGEDDDAEQERRRLNLSGSGQEGDFDLLSSPFSHGKAEEDED